MNISNEGVTIGGNANSVAGVRNVSIGYSNVNQKQNPYSINIGYNSNRVLGQSSIAIGAYSTGTTALFPDNTITISAMGTGTNVIPSTTGTCLIAPIRSALGPQYLMYNPKTYEVSYNAYIAPASETLLSTTGTIDVSGTYPITVVATGTYMLQKGSYDQQVKTIYGISTTNPMRYRGMGSNVDNIVNAFAIDSTRNILYFAGYFTSVNGTTNNRIGRYDIVNNSWGAPLGSGLNDRVLTLALDSSRNMLFIGGVFSTANGTTVNAIVRYDIVNATWNAMGTGITGNVNKLVIDSTRNILYVAGVFSAVSGTTMNNIARYNLTTNTWATAMGTGINSSGAIVNALAIDSSRGMLYIAGNFSLANGVTNNSIVRYDVVNNTWNAMGTGIGGTVFDLVIDSSRNILYVAGVISSVDGISLSSNGICRYDLSNNTWLSTIGTISYQVYQLCLDTTSNILYISGNNFFARYNIGTNTWLTSDTLVGNANAMIVENTRRILYIGGNRLVINNITYNYLTQYDLYTSNWIQAPMIPLNAGVNNEVRAMVVDTPRNLLYLAGYFYTLNGSNVYYICRYDLVNNTWGTLVGTGLNGIVFALAIDSTRNVLYIAGNFTTASGVNNSRIARYDLVNNSWGTALGSGLNGTAYALAIDNTRSVLYVGGDYTTANGITVNYISKYDIANSSWSAIGSGLSGGYVNALAYDSTRSMLYIGGTFSSANGTAGPYLARYDVANNVWVNNYNPVAAVYALAIDNTRNVLYVGNTGVACLNLLSNTYTRIFTDSGSVYAFAIDNTQNILYVGGSSGIVCYDVLRNTRESMCGFNVGGYCRVLYIDAPRNFLYIANSNGVDINQQPTNFITRWPIPVSKIIGPMLYNDTQISSVRMRPNDIMECVYQTNTQSWTITKQSGIFIGNGTFM